MIFFEIHFNVLDCSKYKSIHFSDTENKISRKMQNELHEYIGLYKKFRNINGKNENVDDN